jgi:hypothetical protein
MDFDIKNEFTTDSARLTFVCVSIIICFSIGGFGNIVSLIIFSNKKFKKQTTTIFIKATLVFNISILLYAPVMYLAPIWIVNSLNCKIYAGILIIMTEIKAWIQAIGSLDRLISVVRPQKFLFKNKLIFQIALIVMVCATVVIFVLPSSFFYATISFQNNTVCSFNLNLKWAVIYSQIQYFLLRTILPSLLMIISSCIVSWKIYKNKVQILPNFGRKREVNLFTSLIAFDIFALIFQIPGIIQMLSSANLNFFNLFEYSIFFTVSLISNVFLFIIFIIFNKIYRELFYKYFCKCLRSNRIVPM